MKCPHCKSTWTVSADLGKNLRNCPFCGAALPGCPAFPANAVCRPEDFQFDDEYPVHGNHTAFIRTLKKYTGTDRIIVIPPGVDYIDAGAFSNCPVWEIYIPQGLRAINSSAFKGCHVLRKISLPGGITSIPPHAFEGCHNLEEIEIPGSVQIIGSKAFWFCLNLEHVKLREGVRKIDSQAFAFCNRMRVIEIPDSLEEIHPNAIHCSEEIQVIASEHWKKAHPDLLNRFYYIHGNWDSGRP